MSEEFKKHLFLLFLLTCLLVLPSERSNAQALETAQTIVTWGGSGSGAGSADLALIRAVVGTNIGYLGIGAMPFVLSGDTQQGGNDKHVNWGGKVYNDPRDIPLPAGYQRDAETGLPMPGGWHIENGRVVPPPTQPVVTPTAGNQETSGNAFELCKIWGNYGANGLVHAEYYRPKSAAEPWYSTYKCIYKSQWTNNQLQWSGSVDVLNSSCPSGYTHEGSTCKLTAPDQVKKPATKGDPCVIIRNGNRFSALSDAACENTDVPLQIIDANGNLISITSDGFIVSLPGQDKAKAWGEISANGQTMTITQNAEATKDYPLGATYVTTITNTGSKSVVTNQTVTAGQTDKPAAGTQTPSLTCEQLGTCGVAQETTLKAILNAVNSITGVGDLADAPDTTIEIPDADTSFMPNLETPDLDMGILKELFPKPKCTDPDIKVNALFLRNVDVPIPYCDWASKIRPLVGYLWYALTALAMVKILANVRPSYEAQ